MAAKAVEALLTLSGKGESITEQHVRYVIGLCRSGQSERIGELTQDVICITAKGRPVKPKTIGQKKYVQAAIHKNTVTIGVGPGRHRQDLSGGGGGRGGLPGQAGQPHHPDPPGRGGRRAAGLPARRPAEQGGPLPAAAVRRACSICWGRRPTRNIWSGATSRWRPLAYMRGRTLDDSFIILDEAQNTTREQMKMFLTRMGFGSKIVITGDITQIDLPGGQAQRPEGRHAGARAAWRTSPSAA